MIKILTCFSIVLAVVCGQTCDFQAFHDCMKPSDTDNPPQDLMTEIKAGSEKCLTDAKGYLQSIDRFETPTPDTYF
uniref:Uncharacterized protein n=1 Tax=Romanomermis culicivorax TaxID=13658 RepID=A0A915HKM3_ROMCU